METAVINPEMYTENRRRLAQLLPAKSLAVVNANDLLPTNADGLLLMQPSSDLLYLTGVEQEESILLLFPEADDEKQREILFLREANPLLETWEGHKLTRAEAQALTGIRNIQWLSEFPRLFHRLMCECGQVFLNSNEHRRAVVEVETREARFVADCRRRYPLHHYQRLAPLLHSLRIAKSPAEIALIRRACQLTGRGFRRVLRWLRPGVGEHEVEAEFAHEFIRHGGGFAYPPIIATGANACVLHYNVNRATCRAGESLLLDVAAALARYNSDLTRTVPVSGRFTRRQRQVYNAVLRVMRASIDNLKPGKRVKEWQREAEQLVERELVDLKLLTPREVRRSNPDQPAVKRYFMHGVGHPIGLDVHDVGDTTQPMQPGWVMTVEPGIYIPEERLGIRLENTVVIGENGNTDLMADIPIEAGEIESLMKGGRR